MMNFEIRFTKDKDYYEACFRQFLELKLLRRLEPYLASLMILFGLVPALADSDAKIAYLPWIFTGVGVIELSKALTKKTRWIKKRMKDKSTGELISISFYENELEIIGPRSSGKVKYDAFHGHHKTRFGLSIILAEGNSMFLPRSLFEKEENLNWLTDRLSKSAL